MIKDSVVLKSLKRTVVKMFREFLVYHNSSLEYRAKILTLIISADGEITECEKQKLKEIAHSIYSENQERAELLIDTVNEYHTKIITNNGLNFEHLIQLVLKETREVRRFAAKIDLSLLRTLSDCVDDEDEDDILFKERLLEFMQNLKEEYGVH